MHQTVWTPVEQACFNALSRDDNGELRAFHNVCRHHAAAVAKGCGIADNFTCPYHGWVYGTSKDPMLCSRPLEDTLSAMSVSPSPQVHTTVCLLSRLGRQDNKEALALSA